MATKRRKNPSYFTWQPIFCHFFQFIPYVEAKGVKIEWVQVWTNSIRFAIYAVKSKQTYQTSKTITMTL